MTHPSRNEIWKMFDRLSSSYDRVNRIISFGKDRAWRKKAASFLPSQKNLKVLDLATGTADQALAILQTHPSIHSITGIDLSSEMLEIAKKKVPQGKFFLGDAQKLPFQNETFDAATFSFGIRNVEEPITSLKEIYRILKPKGRVLILEFSLPPQPIKSFFLFYLRYILPRFASFFSGDYQAYRYLNQTIESFPSGIVFCKLMKEAGFYAIKQVPMNLGSVTLYIGEKK